MDTRGLKFAKPEPRVVAKRKRRLTKDEQERLCRVLVHQRDKRHCVVPGCKERTAHLHHIQYRSRGGKWTTQNICSLCVAHHHLVHNGYLTISGNADEELIIKGDKKWLVFKL